MTPPRTIPASKDYPGLLEITREGRTFVAIGDPAVTRAGLEAHVERVFERGEAV